MIYTICIHVIVSIRNAHFPRCHLTHFLEQETPDPRANLPFANHMAQPGRPVDEFYLIFVRFSGFPPFYLFWLCYQSNVCILYLEYFKYLQTFSVSRHGRDGMT